MSAMAQAVAEATARSALQMLHWVEMRNPGEPQVVSCQPA